MHSSFKIALYLRRNIGKPNLSDYILDVGANKRITSILFLKLYKEINIIAFEPLPIFKFKSDQVELMKIAIGAEIGSVKFYICKHNPSSSLILLDYSSNWIGVKAKILGYEANDLYNEIEMPVSTVDKVVAENKITSIFLLKIDTEGGELNVIKGAVETLRMGIIKNIQLESHKTT